jgi:hypothetical protein
VRVSRVRPNSTAASGARHRHPLTGGDARYGTRLMALGRRPLGRGGQS